MQYAVKEFENIVAQRGWPCPSEPLNGELGIIKSYKHSYFSFTHKTLKGTSSTKMQEIVVGDKLNTKKMLLV